MWFAGNRCSGNAGKTPRSSAKICGFDRKFRGVLAMKKLLLVCAVFSMFFLMVATVWADDMGKAETVKGWVSDSKCGVKGANAKAEECTKKCIAEGASMVFVTDKDKKVPAI